jgi:hypothetical protein
MEDTPGHHQVNGQAGFDAVGTAQLSFFDFQTAFQGAMINLNAPAQAVPVELFQGLREGLHRAGGQQQPTDGIGAHRRVDFFGQHRPQFQTAPASLALWRLERDSGEAHFGSACRARR